MSRLFNSRKKIIAILCSVALVGLYGLFNYFSDIRKNTKFIVDGLNSCTHIVIQHQMIEDGEGVRKEDVFQGCKIKSFSNILLEENLRPYFRKGQLATLAHFKISVYNKEHLMCVFYIVSLDGILSITYPIDKRLGYSSNLYSKAKEIFFDNYPCYPYVKCPEEK